MCAAGNKRRAAGAFLRCVFARSALYFYTPARNRRRERRARRGRRKKKKRAASASAGRLEVTRRWRPARRTVNVLFRRCHGNGRLFPLRAHDPWRSHRLARFNRGGIFKIEKKKKKSFLLALHLHRRSRSPCAPVPTRWPNRAGSGDGAKEATEGRPPTPRSCAMPGERETSGGDVRPP